MHFRDLGKPFFTAEPFRAAAREEKAFARAAVPTGISFTGGRCFQLPGTLHPSKSQLILLAGTHRLRPAGSRILTCAPPIPVKSGGRTLVHWPPRCASRPFVPVLLVRRRRGRMLGLLDLTYSWHRPDIRAGFFVFLVRACVIDPRINGSPWL
jgi:hypothetical protein